MNIVQLLHKLSVISNVEVIIALLPEALRLADPSPRNSLLQRLQRIGQRCAVGLAQQKMDMFWHDHIAINVELVVAPHPFQCPLEGLAAGVGREQLSAVVTAEGDEMTLRTVVKAP